MSMPDLKARTSPGRDVPMVGTARDVITAPKEPESKGRVDVVATQLCSSGDAMMAVGGRVVETQFRALGGF